MAIRAVCLYLLNYLSFQSQANILQALLVAANECFLQICKYYH